MRPTTQLAAPLDAGAAVRRRPVPPAVAVLTVAVLLAVALAAWLALRVQQDRAAAHAGERALAAAQAHARTLLSYDYRHLDRDFATAQAALTGTFKDDYARTTTTVVKPVALRDRAVVQADVTAAAVIWARPDQAQVLLFVDQRTTSTRTSGPRVDLNRVRMTLRRTGHGWLVANIEAL
jgi:Mce-associated membrane protein